MILLIKWYYRTAKFIGREILKVEKFSDINMITGNALGYFWSNYELEKEIKRGKND